MAGLWQIGLAVFILLMLPAVFCAIEGRRLPMIANAVLATAGLIYSTLAGGWPGTVSALLTGTVSAILLAACVAATQKKFLHRLMSGAEIQLFAATATWLSPAFTVVAFLTTAFVALAWVAYGRIRGIGMSRPLLPMLAAAPLIFAVFGHN